MVIMSRRAVLLNGSAVGLGRPQPSRFPYPDRPESSPGLGASTGQVVRARKIIIAGTGGGLLVYSSSPPALGNLIESIGAVAGFDQPGNALLPGEVSYSFQAGPGKFVAIQKYRNAITVSTSTLASGPWASFATGITFGVSPTFNTLGLTGDVLSLTGPLLNALIAVDPTAGAPTAETWHTMTLLNSWQNNPGNVVAKYRLVAAPPNSAEIIGCLLATTATAATFFTLPAHYIPASTQQIPAGGTGGVLANNSPFITADTAGNLSVQRGTIGAANVYPFHGTISLDA